MHKSIHTTAQNIFSEEMSCYFSRTGARKVLRAPVFVSNM